MRDASGFTLVDVLAAVVIVGLAFGTVFQVIAAGQASLANARNRTWAMVLGTGKLAEVDLGVERTTSGYLDVEGLIGKLRWQVVGPSTQAGAGNLTSGQERWAQGGRGVQTLEITWKGRQGDIRLAVRGSVDPAGWQ